MYTPYTTFQSINTSIPQAAPGGLPRNWTCADPGAVKDKLADLYPWIRKAETSQARIRNH